MQSIDQRLEYKSGVWERLTRVLPASSLAIAAAFAAMLAVLAVGNVLVFPAIDDAWMQLVQKENGPGSLTRFIYRPLFARMLDLMQPSTRVFEIGGILLTVCSWALLAFVTHRVARLLFPSSKTAIAAALLALAPVITAVQLITLNLTFPVMVPVLCGYLALLLTYERPTVLRLILSACLIFGAMMVSEYTIASVAAAVVLLLGKEWMDPTPRRTGLKTAAVLFAAAMVGYVGFGLTANLRMRPDVSTSSMIALLAESPLETVLHDLNSIWYCLAGAFLQSASAVRFSKEGSVLAAFVFGLFIAALLVIASRRRAGGATHPEPWRRWAIAGTALLAALIAEFLRQGITYIYAGQVEPFSTRFCLPAVPIAAIIFVHALESLSGKPVLASAIVAFIAGHSTFLNTYTQYRNQVTMRRLGEVLRPYVAATSQLTLAVVPGYYSRAYEMTEKASAQWPAVLSRRLWIVWEGQIPLYLHRLPERSGACESMQEMNLNNMGVKRVGRIGQVLWVEPQKDGEFNVERYCVPSYLPPGHAALPVRSNRSAPLPSGY